MTSYHQGDLPVIALPLPDLFAAWAIVSFILGSIVLSIVFLIFTCQNMKLQGITSFKKYRNQTILLTGASSGIGYQLAVLLYCAGARLILVGRNTQALNELVKELLSIAANSPTIPAPPVPEILTCDLSLPETLPGAKVDQSQVYDQDGVPMSISILMEQLSGLTDSIDVFIACAGISTRTAVVDSTPLTNQHVMNLNFTTTQHIISYLIKPTSPVQLALDGKILAVSTVQAHLHIPWRATYAASKSALNAWLKALRLEFALLGEKRQITIVSPGYVNTSNSLNALTGSGEKNGVMDATTQSGLEPEHVAKRILQAGICGIDELLLCPPTHKLIICLQNIFPGLANFFIKRQGKKTMMGMQISTKKICKKTVLSEDKKAK